jgi:transcriptional regulator with XRE-family HTH domain
VLVSSSNSTLLRAQQIAADVRASLTEEEGTVTGSPPVRRRLLGSALRKYREDLGFTLDQAARVLECDRSKVSRIETGQRGIRAKELRELLTDYGVADGEQEALLAIAHSGRQSGWWLEYQDVLSEAGQDYVILELAATEILAFEANQIPDLLQTPQYASALADADANCVSDASREHAIEVKQARQRVVLGARSPRLEVVITEGALRQAVGGVRVMRGQLGWLADVAEAGMVETLPDGDQVGAGARARISLQVLPFAVGAHAAAGCGPMTVLRFAQSPGLGVVHLSGLSGGVSLEDRAEVARYLRTFGQLGSDALPPSASARLLRAIAREERA